MMIRRFMTMGALLLIVLATGTQTANAEEVGTYAFQRTWERTDLPVAANQVSRTWMWGPAASSPLFTEPYAEGNRDGERGERWVQYFDKARMEITDTEADPTAPWYVTNGLLARELITGEMQVGDGSVVAFEPAQVNIAGDPDDPEAPTYATFRPLMSFEPIPVGWHITQTVDRAGHIGNDPSLARFGVTAAQRVDATNHNVASVFWDFMNSTGTIYDRWHSRNDALFVNPFFATGYPISEAYWTTVRVGGEPKQVLVQAFERRVLTYTPDNPEGWKVEAGNVGRHYFEWRYLYQGGNPLLVRSVSYRHDALGNWAFIGDVRNYARGTYESVAVTVNLYDKAGDLQSTATSYLDVSVLQPGEQVPFRVWFDDGAPFSRAEVLVSGRPGGHAARSALEVVNERALAGEVTYSVTGTIRNRGDSPVRFVSYTVAVYDSHGRVIGYDWGLANPATLEPGQTATFRAGVHNLPAAAASYKVFVSAQP